MEKSNVVVCPPGPVLVGVGLVLPLGVGVGAPSSTNTWSRFVDSVSLFPAAATNVNFRDAPGCISFSAPHSDEVMYVLVWASPEELNVPGTIFIKRSVASVASS
mgnify:CR=1 FL=1